MNLTLFARLKKIIKSLSTYHSPLPKAEATWSVTLDRSAMPIKVVAGVVRCLCSDSRISRAVTWPSCARRTVGMSTEHRSWSVAPWYYLQPEFPKSDPFNYTNNYGIIFNLFRKRFINDENWIFFTSDFKVRNSEEESILSLPCTSVSSWDGFESSCRMSWMWKLVLLGILKLSKILQQKDNRND